MAAHKAVLVSLDPATHRAFKVRAATQGISMSSILRSFVTRFLAGDLTVPTPPEPELQQPKHATLYNAPLES